MKKTLAFLLLAMLACGMYAQELFGMRQPVEHVCDSVALKSNGIRKVGVPGKPLPNIGRGRVPIVLVQFADLKFICAESDESVRSIYDKDCNGEEEGVIYTKGKSFCSVRDYFVEQSDSAYIPEFTIIGPVTLDNGYAYYGKDGDNGKDVNMAAFYNEACTMAIQNFNVDWDSFDTNNDGKVDLVFFIYAGKGQNGDGDANTIWPKEGTQTLRVDVDGRELQFGAYGCTNEEYQGKQDGIGTLCHELSHGLGLCDHYDVRKIAVAEMNYGMDYWDVMDQGAYCADSYKPAGYSGYERDFMGWRSLETIQQDSSVTLTLEPLTLGGKAYKLVNPEDSDDYYILENRQNVGTDDALGAFVANESYLGVGLYHNTHGMLVTHVQYSQKAWYDNQVNTTTERMTIVPADGKRDSRKRLEPTMESYINYMNSVIGDPYPGQMNTTSLELLGQTFEIEEKPATVKGVDTNVIVLKVNGGTSGSGTETGIDVVSRKDSEGPYYDLTGRKIGKTQSGVFIRNGQKVLVYK